jgi:hypothetical protein
MEILEIQLHRENVSLSSKIWICINYTTDTKDYTFFFFSESYTSVQYSVLET